MFFDFFIIFTHFCFFMLENKLFLQPKVYIMDVFIILASILIALIAIPVIAIVRIVKQRRLKKSMNKIISILNYSNK